MKKGFRNFVLLCVGVGVVGAAMAAAGAAMGGRTSLQLKRPGASLEISPWGIRFAQGSNTSHGFLDGLDEMLDALDDLVKGDFISRIPDGDDDWNLMGEDEVTRRQLEEFGSLRVEVRQLPVEVKEGDGFAIACYGEETMDALSYTLENMELTVKQQKDLTQMGGHKVVITMPRNSAMEEIDIQSDSGAVSLQLEDDILATSITVQTKTASMSVDVEMCTALLLETQSGAISLEEENIGTARVNTVSGAISVEGALLGQLEVTSQSGVINVDVDGYEQDYTYTCSSQGLVAVNGNPGSASGGQGHNTVHLKSQTGLINLEFDD